ncbi:lysosome-associated membrane glycoprotein 1-like [Leguminivora glycinivorella]|uniref:lysosome-associated membrane glycoprotein 1-like n=1 Tax=Leguminivora glycinivorella TaxID=1035111 RepID=UPI00200C1860|nr:lysosome-associated membrane glycoprotein 1-like [Leguminivora glycinivorella]
MASFKFYFLSALICGALVLGQSAEVPKLPPTEVIDLTTTEAPSTPDTTPDSTTSTTTSTTPSATTSTKPDTTTSTTTSTTSTTTTTPAPPPTPKPSPVPPKPIGPPDQGLWPYVDGKNVTCVIVQFAAQLNVTYGKPNSSSSELIHVILNVPANASIISGNCEGMEQWLTIGWPATNETNHTVTVLFAKNDTTKSYEMKSLNASLVASIFPNITNVNTINLSHQTPEWQTPLAASYRCTPATELKMNADNNNIAATLTLSRLQEEAFRNASGKGFSAARDCSSGDIPDAVPIAVGCALGGMVVVVLIAYLAARRRSAARGYLSM